RTGTAGRDGSGEDRLALGHCLVNRDRRRVIERSSATHAPYPLPPRSLPSSSLPSRPAVPVRLSLRLPGDATSRVLLGSQMATRAPPGFPVSVVMTPRPAPVELDRHREA